MHSGKSEQHPVLSLLVPERLNMGSKGLVGLAAVELFDAKLLALGAQELDWNVGIFGILDGSAAHGVVPVDDVELALGEFQSAAAGP